MSREELIALCEKAVVPQSKWRDRDSAEAHRQLGELTVYLKAGCDFKITPEYFPRLLSVDVEIEGFMYHDWGGEKDVEFYYVPTHETLEKCNGEDWY